ncbi:glutathione S-transferase [Exidia glandulosa HHB12029]|uniref:glutathione transferase n=1 Tax=Exidia glandulosa HHB12029 TaxID=1314781 RepID=A0A165MCS6_EXIGL|nr:glutathione S-transferase [Exidia glandulosa HHB12029]
MLRLYGSRWSPNAKRVALVLLEKQVRFEAVEVDMINREHKNVSYVAKQPFAEVPYIDDEGLVLYESRAICRYICKKYPNQGTPLVPAEDDLRAYGLFEQAASVEIYNFDVHVQAAAYESVVKPALGMKTNKANYEKHLKTLGQKLDIYDSILARQRFITGDEISLVDLFHIPYAVELEDAGCDIMNTRPNVARWWKELKARPSWQAVKETIGSSP